jgi:hypothetical protein
VADPFWIFASTFTLLVGTGIIVDRTRNGFELMFEEFTLANGDHIRRPPRAIRPGFFPCPTGTTAPWAALMSPESPAIALKTAR